MENEYCLTVTYKCNWDCDYCVVDTHRQKEPTLEQIMKNVESIDDGTKVSLTGGEPGFAKKEVLDKVIPRLLEKGCRISVNTNGAFPERYPEYAPYISFYYYHCSLTLDHKVKRIDHLIQSEVCHVLVIDDSTLPKLESFLAMNPDLTFSLHGADKSVVKGKVRVYLRKSNAIKLYQFAKGHPQINQDNLILILERCSGLTVRPNFNRI